MMMGELLAVVGVVDQPFDQPEGRARRARQCIAKCVFLAARRDVINVRAVTTRDG